ncbi:MAG: hypothetical protein SWZ49_23970, partial [Cyanobacteriota bacterium]|nr:hypothetical protein [Cyanobacteriota bacterium]
MYNLPNDDSLNISALSRLFESTTNSYKYLYFLSLLDILKRENFDIVSPISFQDIIVEMLANAWYPLSLLHGVGQAFGFEIQTQWSQLTPQQQSVILFGAKEAVY